MEMVTPVRHKVFVSFHHKDEKYKNLFCAKLGSDIVDKSVKDGDFDIKLKTDTVRQKIRDEFIADASVLVVLVGQCTWQRKHVDWEIGSSLRDTKHNKRCGLVGVLLPTHFDFGHNQYRPNLIPRRLADNCEPENAIGAIYDWPNPWNVNRVREWIQIAFERKSKVLPNNSRQQFGKNRTGPCILGWSE